MWFVGLAVVLCSIAVLLVLSVFRSNIVYFYTPSELPVDAASHEGILRLGGLVEPGSVEKAEGNAIRFVVTDGHKQLRVDYAGTLPNLFREGQGVIAEGRVAADSSFHAVRILAKHDENYMPKDVADKLKNSGYWRDPAKAGAQ
jgi:cytochrome c-type biogenesis protein CcmE